MQKAVAISNYQTLSIIMKRYLSLLFLVFASLLTYGQIITRPGVERDTFQYFSIIDTNYHKDKLPDNFKKSENWEKADKQRIEAYGNRRYNEYSDTLALQDVFAIIDTATQFSQIEFAKSWCIDNYQKSFPHLIARLSDKRKIGLTNTADLIIWERLGTGELEFYGHGSCIPEDIFTIAGRASWILNQLTGENFAVVHGNFTEKQSTEFKNLWLLYIDKLR